jgi:peptide/nickel transport system ATP-binding protein
MTGQPLLSVEQLTVAIDTPARQLFPVQNVSFQLKAGETLGIVGETGSGKTMLVRSVMGLLPAGARYGQGSRVQFAGLDVPAAPRSEVRALWGRRVALIPQNPASSLNPVRKVGAHLTDGLRKHASLGRAEARAQAEQLLRQVGIADPGRRMDMYPHELSGGMKQRVLIAAAIALKPELLIADEPTTALDVTIQRQILDLLQELSESRGMAVLMVTHDLGVIAYHADHVLVMYGGRTMEALPAARLVTTAGHPYTLGLMRSRPDLSFPAHTELGTIPGDPIQLGGLHHSCPFVLRCDRATPTCAASLPEVKTLPDEAEHRVACFNPMPGGTTDERVQVLATPKTTPQELYTREPG